MEDIITPDITTQWKSHHQLLVSKPKNDMMSQLKERASNDMFKTVFPNLSKMCRHILSLNLCDSSFIRKKIFSIKTHLRSTVIYRLIAVATITSVSKKVWLLSEGRHLMRRLLNFCRVATRAVVSNWNLSFRCNRQLISNS